MRTIPNPDKLIDSPKISQKCSFCQETSGNFDQNKNCFMKGYNDFYHKKCLGNYVKECAKKQMKLSNIKCLACSELFDYSIIVKLDENAAKVLYENEQAIGNVNQQIPPLYPDNSKLNEKKPPSSKCHIIHKHESKDQEVILDGVMCPHCYYRGCLRMYLEQNINKFHSIENIKCPVDGCNQFLLSQTISANFPEIELRIKNLK